MPPLINPRHELFAQEVAKGGSLDLAYVKAGYQKNPKNAARLKKNEGVAARIEEILSQAAQKSGVTIEKTLIELARIGYADISRAVEWGPEGVRLKSSGDLPPDVVAAISEVKQTRDGVVIKFHSKTSALELIGKHLGMFRDKIELSGADGGPISVESVVKTSKEFERIARQIADEV